MNRLNIKLNDELLVEVVGAVSERTGNVVGQKQINMIESRLTKRALSLGLSSAEEYIEYFRAHRATEIEDLISILTVHHTYFFREFGQFEFLGSDVLPRLVEQLKQEGRKVLRIWSAACSRGQEAYSLYMYVDQYLKAQGSDIKIEIVATDVDRESVKFASNGVYAWNEVKEIPMTYLSTYWARGTGEIANFAKIKDVVRKACVFQQSNLMETAHFSKHGQFDIIFCRNVFIYFQSNDVTKVAEALAGQLKPTGFLFVGLSESLSNAPMKLKKLGPSIYGPAPQPKAKTEAAVPTKAAGPIRVICVDDSPVILKLLASILKREHGFEIVATAADGLKAAELVSKGLVFDVMTLDVHMPNMTGVEYLEQKMTANHPPVVMLTSASRDNMDLAQQAMKLGAKDYIEKPSLNDLAARSDEIRSKLRMLAKKNLGTTPTSTFDQKFQTSLAVKNYENKVNILFANENQLPQLTMILKDRALTQLPVVLVTPNDSQISKKLSEAVATGSNANRIGILSTTPLESKIYLVTFNDFLKVASGKFSDKHLCYSVLTNLSRSQWESCPKPKSMKVLLTEDVDRSVFLNVLPLVSVMPATSFAYTTTEFFGMVDRKKAG